MRKLCKGEKVQLYRKHICSIGIGEINVNFSIKRIQNHIIYTNIVVALSTGVLCAGFSFAIQIEKWLLYGLFAFFSTLAVYNGQRLFKADHLHQTPWLAWVHRNKKILFGLVVVSAIGAGIVFSAINKLEWSSLILIGIASLISVFYVVKFRGKNMREIPYLKIHLIALTWTIVLIVFPVLNEGINISIVRVGIAHYLYVLAITIPFDIRDLKHDSPAQKTIPQILGITNSRILALMLLVAFAVIMLMLFASLWFNWLFHLSVLVQMALVLFSNENRSDVYYAGWMDGAITLLGASYFMEAFT